MLKDQNNEEENWFAIGAKKENQLFKHSKQQQNLGPKPRVTTNEGKNILGQNPKKSS